MAGSPQLSYGDIGAPFAGQQYDLGWTDITSGVNTDVVNMPFGVMVGRGNTGANGDGALLTLSTATQEHVGVVLFSNSYDNGPNGLLDPVGPPPGLKPQAVISLMKKGRVWVLPEQAVAPGNNAYVRFSPNGAGKLQLGAFRKDADGVAQVSTITPTAVNATTYVLRVEVADGNGVPRSYTFEALSSGAATATTIVTQFKALMAADTAFTSAVTASGAATLILTANVAGAGMVVQSEGDGVMAVVLTTPPAIHAVPCSGRFVTTASANTPAVLEVDLSSLQPILGNGPAL